MAESLGVDSIPASISAEAIQDTSIFTINVTASDPQIAYDVLQAVIQYYPQVAEYIIGDTQLTLMDESGIPENHRIRRILQEQLQKVWLRGR